MVTVNSAGVDQSVWTSFEPESVWGLQDERDRPRAWVVCPLRVYGSQVCPLERRGNGILAAVIGGA